MAFMAFVVLPSVFWGGIFYKYVDPSAGKVVFLTMAIAGAYTCIKGRKMNHGT